MNQRYMKAEVKVVEDADYVCAASSSSSSSLSTETVARGVGSGLRVVVVWRRLLHRASAPLSSLLHRSPLSSSPSLSLSDYWALEVRRPEQQPQR